jgi:hypothetical protein
MNQTALQRRLFEQYLDEMIADCDIVEAVGRFDSEAIDDGT